MVHKADRPTVHDIRAMKTRGQKISMLYVTTLDEAAAANAVNARVNTRTWFEILLMMLVMIAILFIQLMCINSFASSDDAFRRTHDQLLFAFFPS